MRNILALAFAGAFAFQAHAQEVQQGTIIIGINTGDGWKQVTPTVQFGLKRTLDRGA